jgi:ATP-dependent helicase/DNAse subunit B
MGLSENQPSKEEQENWLRSATESHIEKLKEDTPGRSEGVWKIELSRAWLILRQWLRREAATADQPGMRQVEAEYSFGGSGAGGGEASESDTGPAVEVRTASGKTVKFRGQVDRVDISEDGSRVIVYDYKSGSNSAYSKLDSDPVKKGTNCSCRFIRRRWRISIRRRIFRRRTGLFVNLAATKQGHRRGRTTASRPRRH